MEAAQLINQDSGNTEYYTPTEIVDRARQTMGGIIDLDPFSSAIANERVKANHYFTAEKDGFKMMWMGNIWCNHPFSRENNKLIAVKAEQEWEAGRMQQGCFITFAATSETWFKPFLARPQCFLYGRTNYYLPDGTKKKGVTKGSVVTYYGDDVDAFYEAFDDIGEVKVPYRLR